jgi:drug/metabolite transporter (DMT)-like permease
MRGLAGTVALVMYFYTLQNMPLASAVTIQYLSPIFTIIIAGMMLREPPRPIQWLFFVISFGGVLLIKGFDPRVSPTDLIIGISAAIFSALAYNFIRKLKSSDHPLVVVFYFPLVTVPIIGTYTAFNWVDPQPVEWLILILIGLATTAAQIFMTRGYQLEPAANVSIYNYLGTIYAIIFGYIIFDEFITVLAYLGIALILFGVIMSSRYRRDSN